MSSQIQPDRLGQNQQELYGNLNFLSPIGEFWLHLVHQGNLQTKCILNQMGNAQSPQLWPFLNWCDLKRLT